ncbi:MAG TPA: hypothetical protein VM911_19770 [Pyrinomonadaceae bacterium]|jgi:hypothetical protein|nr:hypothetical protein [Pyrinomonadaceae bacterium]
MPTLSKVFDSYKIFYYTNQTYEATIYCYKRGKLVGRMVFAKDGGALPPNSTFGGGPSLSYAISRFRDIVGILLNEKPLYLFLNTDNLMGHLATTNMEPVGEEE